MTTSRKLFTLIFSFLFLCLKLSADDWTLAAQEFSFVQPQDRSESDTEAAKIIPQLILERIAQGKTRSIYSGEILDRELDKLQTERISLFLQLSKEYKTRDSLVLTKKSSGELAKALKEQQEKIAEIETKIDENLKKTDEVTAELTASTDISTERVVLYKNDASSLFTPSKEALLDGLTSRTFAKEVSAAKINGLVTGKVTSYGEYASVTVEMFTFPGCKSTGAITDVGLLTDSLSISRRIVRQLSPKIANSKPVTIIFDIGPVDAREGCVVNIDGVVYPKYRDSVVLDAGIHNITIESSGFDTASINYQFSGEEKYVIKTDLEKSLKGTFSIKLKKNKEGIFYARALEGAGITEENPGATLTINGKSVIGLFSDKDKESAFFYVPESILKDGAEVTVNARTFNREQNIDTRRKGMYRAYTALICSLPFTFYCVGNFTSTNNRYATGTSGISYDDVKKWQNRSYGTIAVTGVCATWFVVEIVRYLKAANDVLPATAY